MICDLAETYHIVNYRELPVRTLAALVTGFRANSRTKMKMTGQRYPDNILIQALVFDRLTQLVWMNSEDGRRNRNRPASLYEQLTKEPKKEEIMVFDSGEEFDRAYAAAAGRR